MLHIDVFEGGLDGFFGWRRKTVTTLCGKRVRTEKAVGKYSESDCPASRLRVSKHLFDLKVAQTQFVRDTDPPELSARLKDAAAKYAEHHGLSIPD